MNRSACCKVAHPIRPSTLLSATDKMLHMDTNSEKIPDRELSIDEPTVKRKERPEPNKQRKRPKSRDTKKTLKSIGSYIKKNHLAVLALVIAVMGGLPGFTEWWQSPYVTGKLVDISYDPKDEESVLLERRIEFKKGVSYYAKAYLVSSKKSYHVANVRAFITLVPNHVREGKLRGSTAPPPNSESIPIQYLSLLEKDRPRLCSLNLFLEGEQKENIDDMAFEKIELRLYDRRGKYKKVELFPSDVPK